MLTTNRDSGPDDIDGWATAKVRVPKASELVAGEVRRQIVRGEIPEGTFLPTESELLNRFGVSRPTLREAFRILESERLITISRGSRSGARVNLPDVAVAANYVGLLLQVSGTTLADVYAALKVIEPPMAKECALHRTRQHLDDMRLCLEREESAIESDPVSVAHYVATFHQLIVVGAGSHTMAVLAGLLSSIFARHLTIEMGAKISVENRKADNRKAVRAHKKLLALVEEQDGDGTEAFWRRHMDVAGDMLLRDFGETRVVDVL